MVGFKCGKDMRKREVIRDHLSLYWQYYAAVAVVVGFLALTLYFIALRDRERAERRNWPVTTAQIVESDIHQVSNNQYSLSTSVVVLLKLRYEVAGRTYVEHYTGSPPEGANADYASSLAVGKSIEIRYSPSDPREVSLYPITRF